MQINKRGLNILQKYYDVHVTIGCGGFCKVKSATHLWTGEKVAIKIIDKIALKDDLKRAYSEIQALKDLKHENIIELYQVLETESMIYMVLEYCVGGELFDYIISRERIPENEARLYIRQIVSPLAYLHSKGYAHRDLKPENILLDEKGRLKLIDFGLCARLQDKLALRLDTCCGSPAYAAPELILGEPYIGSEVDIWSLGVLLFTLLCGFLPFDDDNLSNLYRKIISGHYSKPSLLSSGSLALITRMLEVNPARRINTKQLLIHPWVTKEISGQTVSLSIDGRPKIAVEKDLLKKLEIYSGKKVHEIDKHIQQENYDYIYATYFILLKRLSNQNFGLNYDMKVAKNKVSQNSKNSSEIKASKGPNLDEHNLEISSKDSGFYSYKFHEEKNVHNLLKTTNIHQSSQSFDETLKGEINQCYENEEFNRTKSLESNLNSFCEASNNPINNFSQMHGLDKNAYTTTPKKNESVKNLLGSIEKGIDKIIYMLSPAKKSVSHASPQHILKARDVKILNNVSTSSLNNSEELLSLLKEALINKGIEVKQKGLRLRGKLNDACGNSYLTFELEIVYIPEFKMYGIRRKRLVGDSWHYKKICEEVLALTSTLNHD